MRKEDMPPADAPMIQLARYRCHKDVLAAKITAVQHLRDGSASLTIVDEHGNEVVGFGVSPSYVAKHEPQVGGYYVCYSDGYESWSPAHQFEQGYARLDGGQNSSERGVDLRVHILEFGQIVDTESQDLNLVMRARPFDVPEKELRPSSAINQVKSSSLGSGVSFLVYDINAEQTFGDLPTSMGLTGTPSVVVIGRDGNVVNAWSGVVDEQMIRQALSDARDAQPAG